MRRTYFFIVVLFGMATATFAQTTSSDSQTLQALLAEIRHLDDARSKLAEVQVVIRSEAAEIKHYEDSGDHAAQVEDALNRAKADLEASTILAQQRQSTETDAEQQMRTEQDKLDMLESRLDELVGKIGSPSAQPARVPR